MEILVNLSEYAFSLRPVKAFVRSMRWYLIFYVINIYISGPDIFRQFLVTLDMMPLISKFSSFYKGRFFPWLLEEQVELYTSKILINETQIYSAVICCYILLGTYQLFWV